MKILKIKGKDEEAIYEEIKKEYGDQAVIINSHQENIKGIKGWFKKPTYTVTIAVEKEKEPLDPNCKKSNKDDQRTADYEQVNSLNEVLIRSLIDEGIMPEVVRILMKDIDMEQSVEGIARGFYSKLVECLAIEESTYALEEPCCLFFIGPTGVGKTTTIAKLTADYVLNRNKQVALFTADTYRIAAIEQLKTYAEIIDVPVEVVYEEDDFLRGRDQWQEECYILVDTAGRSHKNITEVEKIKALLKHVSHKKVFLVLGLGTNYKDARNIIDLYKEVVGEFSLIFTKLDETDAIGNLVNIATYAQMPIAYITTGQDVPDDIERFDADVYIKQLLGRISYE